MFFVIRRDAVKKSHITQIFIVLYVSERKECCDVGDFYRYGQNVLLYC
jgi:hypothetical protein